MKCPEGLLFNPKFEVCDWARNVRCEWKASEGPECANPGQRRDTDVYIADERDCSKYYRCFHGTAHSFRCPYGLKFNPKKEGCDWPWNAEKYCKEDGGSGSSEEWHGHRGPHIKGGRGKGSRERKENENTPTK